VKILQGVAIEAQYLKARMANTNSLSVEFPERDACPSPWLIPTRAAHSPVCGAIAVNVIDGEDAHIPDAAAAALVAESREHLLLVGILSFPRAHERIRGAARAYCAIGHHRASTTIPAETLGDDARPTALLIDSGQGS
jgi:hypothetical protein